MTAIRTHFSLAGIRTYVQGARIFQVFVDHDPCPQDIECTFHRPTDRQCELVSSASTPEQPVVATYRSRGAMFTLVELAEVVQDREQCTQERTLALAQVESGRGTFQCKPGYPGFVESAVAVYKAILNRHPRKPGEMLYFAQMKVRELPQDGDCTVEHVRSVGDRFLHARLLVEGGLLGRMIFAVK
jgi:hypothetical protein